MIIIGLTGNIGSGKSIICMVFESLGIPVFYADIEAKKILHNKKLTNIITEVLGKEILNTEGEIDNKKLASTVFGNKQKLGLLNDLIHPEVYQAFTKWLDHQNNSKYAIIEAAILFESGFDKYVDLSINVYAEKSIRIKRISKRDKIKETEILKRMNNQLSDEEKIKLADFTIYNDGKLVIPQILDLHKKISSMKKEGA